MENLTNEQKSILIRGLGNTKFTELAKAANCSLDAVREFATIEFEARKEACKKEEALATAQRAAQKGQIDAAIAEGDVNRALGLWTESFGNDIILDIQECNSELEDDIRKEVQEKYREKYDTEIEKETEEIFHRQLNGEISTALQDGWQEYLKTLAVSVVEQDLIRRLGAERVRRDNPAAGYPQEAANLKVPSGRL
jgi:hypothetical protein